MDSSSQPSTYQANYAWADVSPQPQLVESPILNAERQLHSALRRQDFNGQPMEREVERSTRHIGRGARCEVEPLDLPQSGSDIDSSQSANRPVRRQYAGNSCGKNALKTKTLPHDSLQQHNKRKSKSPEVSRVSKKKKKKVSSPLKLLYESDYHRRNLIKGMYETQYHSHFKDWVRESEPTMSKENDMGKQENSKFILQEVALYSDCIDVKNCNCVLITGISVFLS